VKNSFINAKSAHDIDGQIDRIHRDIGYSGGKVELSAVRELLKLDLRYYQLDDPGLIDEVLHKLKVGTRQVITNPLLLLDAVKKFDLSALYLPDRKRIYIDQSTHDLKKRWFESHEIAHSVIPWHAEYMLGDTLTTLAPTCHQIIEAEANYGAGRLLFPHQNFKESIRATPLDFNLVRALAKSLGNTITSTLWRAVEQHNDIVFATVGGHPHHLEENTKPIDYLIRSPSFSTQFSNLSEEDIWSWVLSYCKYTKTGPLGTSEILLVDINNDAHIFLFESFGTKYGVLTIGKWVAPAKITVPIETITKIPL
jgi:hypothetical protein